MRLEIVPPSRRAPYTSEDEVGEVSVKYKTNLLEALDDAAALVPVDIHYEKDILCWEVGSDSGCETRCSKLVMCPPIKVSWLVGREDDHPPEEWEYDVLVYHDGKPVQVRVEMIELKRTSVHYGTLFEAVFSALDEHVQ